MACISRGVRTEGKSGLVGFFVFYIGEELVSVGLIDQLFQPASNQVETVEKAFACLCRVIVARVRAIPTSYRVSTENGWKVFY